jgi:protease YdgD
MKRPLVALLLLAAAPALAQPRPIPRSTLPGIGAADPRRPVDGTTVPWRGLGRVQLEIGGRCTGTLVAPRLVLTAAHCVVSSRTQQLVQPGTVHFLLGYQQGEYIAHARVASFRIGAGYTPATGLPAAADWALLTLETALPADRVLPLLREAPAPRSALMLGGYQQDRPEVLLADTGCRALGISGPGGAPVLLHDCAGTRGSSGAPLLAQGADGRWGVAGVASRVQVDVALGQAVPAGSVGAVP